MNSHELNDRLLAARILQSTKGLDNRRRHARHLAEMGHGEVWAEEFLMPRLQKAIISDYKKWLAGYLEAGGEITHCYDYPFSRKRFFIANQDIEVPPLFGARSIGIIVPDGLTWSILVTIGHNEIYQMDGFRQFGGSVPIFSDLVF